MHLQDLTDRYQVSKAGTSKVVTWLVQQGRHFCDISSITKPRETRLTRDSERIEAPATILSSARGLIELKQALVTAHESDSTNSTLVPAAVLELLDEVIAGRQACAEWYQQQIPNDESNMSHAHFIQTLQRVEELLRRLPILHKAAQKHINKKSTS
ncbi:hypothetical protein DOTSEDRAFT_34412 [Dothistroma septosporum NZE10]|uniref:DUF6604 domain-containing protein n=1 Tax=Dothistroma septosporum (strain NZE10 / CBS 128990) TaxID=675120 RepID=N1PLD3_DOTSN|nr:hypothetical protein DOTSEDRAFT_34412 [Dothistroma septosporum NZE10]